MPSPLTFAAPVRFRAFTRRELIVVVGILGLGLVVLIPWLLNRREESRRLTCERHLIALNKATLAYESRRLQLPGYCSTAVPREGEPRSAQSWAQSILSYLEESPAPGIAAKVNDPQTWPFIPKFACPDYFPVEPSDAHGWLGYVANTGVPDVASTATLPADWPANGVLLDEFREPRPPGAVVTLKAIEMGDGAAYTLLFSENLDCGYLTDTAEAQVGFVWLPALVRGIPNPGRELCRLNAERGQGDGSLRFARPSSLHPHGVNAAFVSGRTQFLLESIDYLVYCQLMSSDGANVKKPGSDDFLPPPFRTPPEPAGVDKPNP